MLSGDNVLKVRDDPGAPARARNRYLEARAIAVAAGLDDLVAIIDVRLTGSGAPDGAR